jgi:hypothetical protein
MNPLKAGIGLAAVVAGPPLYELVSNGDLDTMGAVQRGGLVAVGCALGVSVISRIVRSYEVSSRRTARQRHHDQLVAAALSELDGGKPKP